MKRAFTLIELLVVIAILGMVTIATVPLLTPALDTRRVREAARMASTFFAQAQSEALANGRPVGVWIQRLKGEPTAAMDLFLCEVPKPWAGGTIDTRVRIVSSNGQTGFQILDSSNMPDDNDYGLTSKLIKAGDQVRFDAHGQWYQIGDAAVNTLTADADGRNTVVAPNNNSRPQGIVIVSANIASPTLPQATGNRITFQIVRQPVKSSSPPLQLPGGAVLDLFFSGMGNAGNFGTAGTSDPIIVTFNKSGGLDAIYWGGTKHIAADPIYFLIGKREKLPHAAGSYVRSDPSEVQDEKHNFRDLENIWISINPQTGLVSTAEVAQLNDATIPNGNNTEADWIASALSIARSYATSAQTMGGR